MNKMLKNKAFKAVLIIFAIGILIFFAAKYIRITPASKTAENSSEFDESKPKIILTIEFTKIYKDENYSKLNDALKSDGILPEDGYFAKEASVNFESGDTVFDVLTDFCSANNIQIDYESANENVYGTAYVKGIGGLYSGDCTKNSGWIYSVDGEMPNVGMSDFTVSDGEEITVSFTVY